MFISFGFFGSSNDDLSSNHEDEVRYILNQIVTSYKKIRIITGGYHGIMKSVCRIAKELVKQSDSIIHLETYGILYSGYEEEPNKYIDKCIECTKIGERVDTILELSDYLFALPGSHGTYHEILQTIEVIKYPSKHLKKFDYSHLWVSKFWRDKISDPKVNFIDKSKVINIGRMPEGYVTDKIEDNKKGEFLDKINKLIGRFNSDYSNILAFDFAFTLYSLPYKINYGKNVSKSVSDYTNILNQFLRSQYTLLSVNEDFRQYEYINSNIFYKEPFKLQDNTLEIKKHINNDYKLYAVDGFNEWNRHLMSNDFGKISFWVNRFLQIDQIDVNLSCFLVINIDLTKAQCDQVLLLMDQYISDYGVKEITEQLKKYITTTKKLQDYTEQLERFKEYATTHKHIIKNLSIQFPLKLLKDKYMKDSDQLSNELWSSIRNTEIVRILASQLFYSYDNKGSKDLFDKIKIKTISSLLNTIYLSGKLQYKDLEVFECDTTTFEKHKLNTIAPENFLDVFNILFNLYSNTRNHCDDTLFFIKVKSNIPDKIIIEFITQTDMLQKYVDNINNRKITGLEEYKGFRHIISSLNRLDNYDIVTIKNTDNTVIKLIIT